MKQQFDKAWFSRARVGLFTHYTYATYAENKGTNWGGTWFARNDPRPAASPASIVQYSLGTKASISCSRRRR